MKPVITWILIANSEEARICLNAGPGRGVEAATGMTWKAELPNEYADQPGRSFDSKGTGRHKLEPRKGGVAQGEAFAKLLSEELAKCHRKSLFDRLILCAPPAMLGLLRKQVSAEIGETIIAEVSKDLVSIAPKDLGPHFEHVLAV
jgi:protein required for attachment to host cells